MFALLKSSYRYISLIGHDFDVYSFVMDAGSDERGSPHDGESQVLGVSILVSCPVHVITR